MSWATSCRPRAQLTIVDFPTGGPSQNTNHSAIGQPLPRKAQNQRIKLGAGQLKCGISVPPAETPLIESAMGEPDAVPIMDQHFHPVRPPMGKQVGMMGPGFTEDLDNPGQNGFSAGTHIQRRGR